jgi:hypothetical protein
MRVSEHADPGRDDHRLVGLGDGATCHVPRATRPRLTARGSAKPIPDRQYT